jgi:hypothetical protein
MKLPAAIRMFALALAPAAALAQAPAGNPPLASLNIEIWPEYDRAGAVLVILNAELAPEVKLPAAVTLRLPASSGGPSAVAFAKAANAELLNLKHERSAAGEAIVVRAELPERHLHVEFYQPIATVLPARSFGYTWPGDFAAARATLVVQEPAASSSLEAEPRLDRASIGGGGMRYHAAELGALEAGKPRTFTVRYTRLDLRPSAEIMKTQAGGVPAQTPAPAGAPAPALPEVVLPAPARAPATAGAPFPGYLIALLALAGFAIAGAVMLRVWRRRSAGAAPLAHGACTKCGAPRRQGDRFCGKCGAKLG